MVRYFQYLHYISEDIDHVIISRQKFCVFRMTMFIRAANQFSPLLKETTTYNYMWKHHVNLTSNNDKYIVFTMQTYKKLNYMYACVDKMEILQENTNGIQ